MATQFVGHALLFHRCKSFAVLAGGSDCHDQGPKLPPRWHTYPEGNGSLTVNPEWVTYAKYSTPPTPPPPSVADELRCGLRQLAIETADARLRPIFGDRAAQLVADAVRIQECPHHARGSRRVRAGGRDLHVRGRALPDKGGGTDNATLVFWISPQGSDETGNGSASSPFFSPHRARDAIRALRQAGGVATVRPATVMLAGGVYHIGGLGPLVLTSADSFTTWLAADATMPVLSGAALLGNLTWRVHTGSVQVTDVPRGMKQFMTLFDEADRADPGRRLIRARYPNGDPEQASGLCFMGNHLVPGIEGCSGFLDPAGDLGNQFVGGTLKTVRFNTTRGGLVPGDDVYREYNVLFQAPPANLATEGYPVAVCNQGEGGGQLYNRSASVVWKADDVLDKAGSWARPQEAVVHMMHNGWGNVQFAVASVDTEKRAFVFERGGFQHGRQGRPSKYWVENQLELLDAPGEWYHDAEEGKLYLWPNSSLASRPGSVPVTVSAALTETLVWMNGTARSPVDSVAFRGVGFSRTLPTFLRPYERPISGDWAIHRGGTVLVTGATNATFDGCNFTRTGGNALTFSRHVRSSIVRGCEFFSVGDSAVVAYGDLDWDTGDARAGNYPSGLAISQNLMREIGVWGKQVGGEPHVGEDAVPKCSCCWLPRPCNDG